MAVLLLLVGTLGLVASGKDTGFDPDKISVNVLQGIEVYPTPATDFIKIKFEETPDSEVKIQLISFIGNKMEANLEKLESNEYKINLRAFPAGHYYILVTQGESKFMKKFIKR